MILCLHIINLRVLNCFLLALFALSQKLLSPVHSPEVHPCYDQNMYPKAVFCLVPPKGPAPLATAEQLQSEF